MTTLLDMTNNALPNGKVKVPPKPKEREPIEVNGVRIAVDAISAEAQNHPAENPAKSMLDAARALVVRELLVQEAKAHKIAAVPEALGEGLKETEEDAATRALLDAQVTTPKANEEDCRRYFDANQAKFRTQIIYEARHILFAASAKDSAARKEAKIAAEVAIATLLEDPSQFAALAHTYSACPSKEQGGNLGQLMDGSTVPAFEAALKTLKERQMTKRPVATDFGFHVIQLDRIIPGKQMNFEMSKGRIAAWLEAASWSRAVSQYIGILVGKAKISGIDMSGAGTPLVQ